MNETTRKGSLEPASGAHLHEHVDHHDALVEHTHHLHYEHDEDPRYSWFARGLHETPGFNLIEAEDKYRSEMLVALNALNKRDLRTMKQLMLSRMHKGLRVLSYALVPLLITEALFVWKNAPTLQRLQQAAASYERYRQAIEKSMQTNSEKRQSQKLAVDAYILKQIKLFGGEALMTSMQVAIDFSENISRFSPLLATRLAQGDGRDQEKFSNAWQGLGRKMGSYPDKLIDKGLELVAEGVAGFIKGASGFLH